MVRTGSKVAPKPIINVQTVYECIANSKGNGVTNDDIAAQLGIAYHSARRWALILIDHKKIQSRKFPDGRFRYLVGEAPYFPVVSHYHKKELPIPLPSLIQALEATPPNNQLQVVLTKKMGLNLATLAHFAASWALSETSTEVPPKVVARLRSDMEMAMNRALWQAQVYKEVLALDYLWDGISAPLHWFNDDFTTEDARELYISIRDQVSSE